MRDRYRRAPGLAWLACLLLLLALLVLATGTAAASPDESCLMCHQRRDMAVTLPGGRRLSLFVDSGALQASVHGGKQCVDCHSDVRQIPHGPVAAVNCTKCHYTGSTRGPSGAEPHEYRMSIHARVPGGARCQSCHGTHDILPAADPRSRINRQHLPAQCGSCHADVYRHYAASVHGRLLLSGRNPAAATCSDCHSAHGTVPPTVAAWQAGLVRECGSCHRAELQTYNRTYHGKVTRLGYVGTVARCSDCHGSHAILPVADAASTLSPANRPATCRKCHPAAGAGFARFYAHAEETNRSRYPVLFYTYWFMTLLLVGVFSFFLLHSALWLQRALGERLQNGNGDDARPEEQAAADEPAATPQVYYQRLRPYHRLLHLLVIVSFLGLALTGLPLKYSAAPWAQSVSHLLGGFARAGLIHRVCAVITLAYFVLHLLYVLYYVGWVRRFRFDWLGPDSMVPRPKDLVDFYHQVRWFLWLGPRPRLDRWTYWEKFDYFAVFWGVAIIGASGLLLWFPEFFALLLPGWVFNVATLIHSDEALLAAGFIFSIHFFNTHFRPEKFPMDRVIFTGRIELREWQEERPAEYERLQGTPELEHRLVGPPSRRQLMVAWLFGFTAVAIGLILLILIVWAQFWGGPG